MGWRDHAGARLLGAALSTLLAATLVQAPGVAGSTAATQPDRPPIYLVTLTGAGTAGSAQTAAQLEQRQDLVLAAVGGAEPVYRWTTALNGFAARLTDGQVATLRGRSDVSLVEANDIRRLTAGPATGRRLDGHRTPGTGDGRNTVIGLVDTGIWPESPLFATSPALGRGGFTGTCQAGQQWSADQCSAKLVGARWFVEGFGADRLRSSSYLSPRDDSGHGTQLASIAGGNARVDISVRGERLGRFSGSAPLARLAVYKSCWSAPDPADDGCATADVVTAVDRATADGVDVLNLPIDGADEPAAGFDTVDRALLGAAEADIVVVTAAGNDGGRSYAAHAVPWATTVGAATAPQPRGLLRLGARGPRLSGAMTDRRPVRGARLVRGAEVPSAGSSRTAARLCVPGSLDAARVAGRVVVCDRGRIGRVDKSAAVARADGAGMILVNNRAEQALDTDLHSVPTLQVRAGERPRLHHWLDRHPRGRVTLRPARDSRPPAGAAAWSAGGDPRESWVKPDLVAPGAGLLSARPMGRTSWGYLSGTSGASALVAGEAASLRASRPRWTEAEVRSALATSADSAGQSPLRQGAGVLDPAAATEPGLLFDTSPARYRGLLDGEVSGAWLNTPSLRFDPSRLKLGRSVRSVGPGRSVWSVRVEGLGEAKVSVAPAALTMRPGQVARFRMQVFPDTQGRLPAGEGTVVWTSSDGRTVRVPVVIAR